MAFSEKIILIGYATAKEDKVSEAHNKIVDFLKLNADEPGCELSALHVRTKNDNNFMVYEIWKNKAGWFAHLQTKHVSEFSESSKDFFEEVKFTTYKQILDDSNLDKYDDITPLSKKVGVLAQCTVCEGKNDAMQELIAAFLEKVRQEEGCVAVFSHVERDNECQVMIYEVWQDQNAWLTHLQQEHTTHFAKEYRLFADNVKLETFACLPIALHHKR